MTRHLITVFDIESVGLHGEAFAWATHTVDLLSGEMVEESFMFTHPKHARGSNADREWVMKNCHIEAWQEMAIAEQVQSVDEIRRHFWEYWCHLTRTYGINHKLAADVPWPVEARFLSACVEDDKENRVWIAPYPLLDVASIRLAAGFDPLADGERLPSELPTHNPLADSRQSARLLVEALNLIKALN